MSSTIDRQLRAAAKADKILTTIEDKQIQRLNQAIDSAFSQLIKELKGKLSNTSNLIARERAILLANDLRDTLNVLNPASVKTKALRADFERLVVESDLIGNKLGGELIKPITINVESSADISLEAAAAVADEGYRRLLQHGETFANNASVIVQQSILLGWGVGKATNFLKANLGITRNSAEMIVRTETIRASVSATKERFAKNAVEAVIWISTEDKRVCQYCSGRSGSIYEMAKVIIPLHPRCRCFILPYKKEWEDAGLIDRGWMNNHATNAQKLAGGKELKQAPWEKQTTPKKLVEKQFIPDPVVFDLQAGLAAVEASTLKKMQKTTELNQLKKLDLTIESHRAVGKAIVEYAKINDIFILDGQDLGGTHSSYDRTFDLLRYSKKSNLDNDDVKDAGDSLRQGLRGHLGSDVNLANLLLSRDIYQKLDVAQKEIFKNEIQVDTELIKNDPRLANHPFVKELRKT